MCVTVPNFVPIDHYFSRVSIFQDGGRPPSLICFTHLDYPQRVFSGLCHCAKFGCYRCSSFDNMLVFTIFRLKMPIHAHKIGFMGFDSQNGE